MPYQFGGNSNFGGAPFTGQQEEEDPFTLSPYLASTAPRPGQTPGISDYFNGATPPINGRPPVEEMPPSEDMSPPPGDPLMDELDRAKDWKNGAALGLGAALGGIFGGSGAADAAGAGAATTQNHMLEAIQQSRALQAKDRENRFRLSEEKIQGAEKMMNDLHGVDMANMPDHVKQEMTRLTQLYNQKLQGGLTEKEATEVLAMGARMQQLLQEAKADPAYGAEKARVAGEQARIQGAAQLGVDPKNPDYHGQDSRTWSLEERARIQAKARVEAANIAAKKYKGRFDRGRWDRAYGMALSAAKYNDTQGYREGEVDPLAPEIMAQADAIYQQMQERDNPSATPQQKGDWSKVRGGSANASGGEWVNKGGRWVKEPMGGTGNAE